MIVFRLSKKKYRNDISGKGVEIAGGRWNSVGNAILYTAENRALCTAEIAIHTPLGIVPLDYFLITIEIPDGTEIHEVKISDLPENWNTFPYLPSTKKIGDAFLTENKLLAIKVPSAVIQGDFNYLINPDHKDFKKIKVVKIEPFEFDKRLFDK